MIQSFKCRAERFSEKLRVLRPPNHANGRDRFRIALTQKEIADMIGVSRETVTRALSTFKHRNLIAMKDCEVIICNRCALHRLAGK
jgi:CRP/FNR family transcriptional regulator